MRIFSLNVGLPSAQLYEGREIITGGAKKPVPRAMLRFGNLEGDGQADLVNHGGLEKAVCVYPFDHYPYWNRQLRRYLKPGAFSENITISGAIETEVCVGDVFQIGGAMVQVSQPRMPCTKLAGKNESKMLPKLLHGLLYAGVVGGAGGCGRQLRSRASPLRAHHYGRGEQHHLREVQ
jgi:MOSC domain-containing protein YiiM